MGLTAAVAAAALAGVAGRSWDAVGSRVAVVAVGRRPLPTSLPPLLALTLPGDEGEKVAYSDLEEAAGAQPRWGVSRAAAAVVKNSHRPAARNTACCLVKEASAPNWAERAVPCMWGHRARVRLPGEHKKVRR